LEEEEEEEETVLLARFSQINLSTNWC